MQGMLFVDCPTWEQILNELKRLEERWYKGCKKNINSVLMDERSCYLTESKEKKKIPTYLRKYAMICMNI